LKLTKSAKLLPSTAGDETKSQLLEQMKEMLKEVLSVGNWQQINVNHSTYAEVVMSLMVGCGANLNEIACALEIDRMSC
jgi:hypothetical protein